MKLVKIISFILALAVTFASLCACEFERRKAGDAVEIDPVEYEFIETMQSEGKEPFEIAEALTEYEDAKETEKSLTEEAINETEETSSSEIEETTTEPSEETQVSPTPKPAEQPPEVTATPKPTEACAATEAPKPTSNPTATLKPTIRPTSTPNPTAKPTSTPKPTSKPTATTRPTNKPTSTPKPTTKPTSTPKPTVTPKPTATPAPYYNTDKEKDLLRLINNLRKEMAVSEKCTYYVPFVINSSLTERAHIRCMEITEDFSHYSPSGNSSSFEACLKGYGKREASSFYNLWLISPTHKSIMIYGCTAAGYGSYECGIGLMEYNNQSYGVLLYDWPTKGTPPASGYVEPTNTPTPVPTNTPVPTATPVPTTKPEEET